MQCRYACQSADHVVSRRSLLGGFAAGAAGIAAGLGGALASSRAIAGPIQAKNKRVLNIFLHGGVSQLETWDPKPNTDTGGPFRAIPTSVPANVTQLAQYQFLRILPKVQALAERAFLSIDGDPSAEWPTIADTCRGYQ